MPQPMKQRDSATGAAIPAFPALRRDALATLQVNVGYRCNQACAHCHVDAGPQRTEEMSRRTADEVLDFVARAKVGTLDITGGAPELNPSFRHLVTGARARAAAVIDRCNLTVLEEGAAPDLPDFLAANEVRVIASLPCYGPANVDAQRGRGVFEKSIRGLHALNARGYGVPGSGLVLDLVYNPLGARLPPPQAALEATYRAELGTRHGVVFNHLLTLANMPIARFRHALEREGGLAAYQALLVAAHRPENLAAVMCRSLLSVDWQGYCYDCDFNQMLGLPLGGAGRTHLSALLDRPLAGRSIAVAAHCYGCTAGQGSSCGGALGA